MERQRHPGNIISEEYDNPGWLAALAHPGLLSEHASGVVSGSHSNFGGRSYRAPFRLSLLYGS
jgi:hypothetical protein